MIEIEMSGRSVLVTGGTRGLGRAIGLEFARAGATVFLTHHWQSADERALLNEYSRQGLEPPHILEADVADADQTREVLHTIRETVGTLDIFISNVAFSKVITGVKDLKKNSFDLSLGYSAWPLIDYVQAAQEVIGKYPRYVLAVSSDGAQVCHSGYDLAGSSKAVLETLCRYLAVRLKGAGVRVNAIRPGFLDTASSRSTFGDAVIDSMQKEVEGLFLEPQEVARAAVALCSGLMDAITGQVITIDEGWSLIGPMEFVTRRGLPQAFPKDGG